MNILVLDQDFNQTPRVPNIIDSFESVIWTDRYSQFGDFQLESLVGDSPIMGIRIGDFLRSDASESIMIVETISQEQKDDGSSIVKISGRSIESILSYRIVWDPVILTGNIQQCIKQLVLSNLISPVDPKRKIDLLEFEDNPDPRFAEMMVDTQYDGVNLYDAICELCSYFGVGFRMRLANKKIKMSLYIGEDRSASQLKNPRVVFSSEFEAMIGSEYLLSSESYKNVALVSGEDRYGYYRTIEVSNSENATGLSRREMFVDSSYMMTSIDGEPIPDDEFMNQLAQSGYDSLMEQPFIETFDGQINSEGMYKIKEDYYLGDIVQFQNDFGLSSKSRVTEIIYSQDPSEKSIYPTFQSVY